MSLWCFVCQKKKKKERRGTKKLTNRNRISVPVLLLPHTHATLFLKRCHHIKGWKKEILIFFKKDLKGQKRAYVFLLSPIDNSSKVSSAVRREGRTIFSL